jgi:4'-phosphopantetheinyl transferase
VWVAEPDSITDPALLRRYESCESGEERARRLRLRFERDRRERLVSVALARTTLSRYADVEPGDWVFERNEHGRPDPVPGQGERPLRFNVSHAHGLVACAVAVERAVGVDVEWVERRGDPVAIARRWFDAAEAAELEVLPATRRRERFFEYWTLKESYVKARGLGLGLLLRSIAFDIADERRIDIRIDPELDDDPRDWQFALFRPGPAHVLAVAVRRGRGHDLALRVRRAVPLAG